MGADQSLPATGLPDPRGDPGLPLDALRRIDRLCERFEQSLQAGAAARAEDYLAELQGNGAEERALLRELLALDLEYRHRRGQPAEPAEYFERFPSHRQVVALVFQESQSGLPESVPEFCGTIRDIACWDGVGSGGMGTVYRAEHRVLNRTVALKVINPELLADAAAVERFVREARAAACLSHPHVVTVFDAETAGGGHFLVMEYVAGTDLAQVVARRGPLPVPLACDYIRQAALGLQHAHEHGMVHRDITPRNLMLTEQGQVKVLDFGLAYFISEARSAEGLAAPETLLGSVDCMAPEQAADPHAADVRADVYGLGCVLYFLLAGRPPFPQGTLEERFFERHAERTPPPIGELRDDVPQELAAIVGRMLAKSPADRYQTPGEVAAALAPFAGAERPARAFRRRAWLAAVAAALVCGLPLAGWYLGRTPGDGSSAGVASQSSEAYRLYREGVSMVEQRQEPQMQRAVKRLESAVEADPDYAPALAALADAYNLSGDYGWAMPDQVLPKAKEAAHKALALDKGLAQAHLALAFAVEAYDCDWKQAEAEYLRALQLRPQLSAAHHWYAWFLIQQGRADEADRQIQEAVRLGPDKVIIANNAGKILYLRRRYALAVEKYRYALELNPDFRKAHRDLGMVYAEMGKLTEALAELKRSRGLTADDRDLLGAQAYAYARNGHPSLARHRLAQLEPLADEKPLAYEIATVYAALGDKERAFTWLQRALAEHSPARTGLAVDPRLDNLRADPRFKTMLKRLGLLTADARAREWIAKPGQK